MNYPYWEKIIIFKPLADRSLSYFVQVFSWGKHAPRRKRGKDESKTPVFYLDAVYVDHYYDRPP